MIFFGDDITRIMGVQPDLYGVPDIGPAGMMIHFLRFYRHAGHKSKCLGEISETEFTVEGVVVFGPHSSMFCFYLGIVWGS
jgi:hypothetical protein